MSLVPRRTEDAMSRKKPSKSPPAEALFVSKPTGGERYTVSRTELIAKLFERGWLAYETETEALSKATDQELRTSLLAYQHFHGLDADGWAGPVTQRSLDEPRFCMHPDVMPMQQELSRWKLDEDSPRLTWTLKGRLGNLSDTALKDAFAWAWAAWAEVCWILPEYVASENEAMVVIGFGGIDRAGGTLAWSELPAALGTKRLTQKYDSAEPWVVAENPKRLEIDLGRVACHEIGHALGLPHLAAGNLLQPTYDPLVRKPQAGDVQEIVARYGPPRPGRPSPLPTGGAMRIVLDIEGGLIKGGELPGWKLVPMAS